MANGRHWQREWSGRGSLGEEDEFTLIAFQSASPYVDTISGAGTDYTYVVQYRGNRVDDVGQSSAQFTVAARGALAAQNQEAEELAIGKAGPSGSAPPLSFRPIDGSDYLRRLSAIPPRPTSPESTTSIPEGSGIGVQIVATSILVTFQSW